MSILKPFPDFLAQSFDETTPNGFTLIELLVVLAIMSLAAILFIGAGGNGKGIERKSEIAKLQIILTKAHHKALQTGESQSVELSEYQTEFKPALGNQSKKLLFYSDGSANGGVISSRGQRIFEVRWIDGAIIK